MISKIFNMKNVMLLLSLILGIFAEENMYFIDRTVVPTDNGDILGHSTYSVGDDLKIVYSTKSKKLLFYDVELDENLKPALKNLTLKTDTDGAQIYSIQHIKDG